jgi:hypothetical protein
MIGFQTLLLKEILRLWKGQASGSSRGPRDAWDASPTSAADFPAFIGKGRS